MYGLGRDTPEPYAGRRSILRLYQTNGLLRTGLRHLASYSTPDGFLVSFISQEIQTTAEQVN
jgi:hypothetical protein